MFNFRILALSALALCTLLSTSCQRSSQDTWEDARTCGRHLSRGIRALGGGCGDSRAVCSRDDFAPCSGPGEDFIPLPDQYYNNEVAMGDYYVPQPAETPGEAGSSVPGIDAFHDPATNPRLANVFRNVNFEYNSNFVRGQDNLNCIHNIANYMRQNPNTYVFVEGHCDERGPEAYNLALGSRRGNAVRSMLIQEGVSPDNIFTISYGKERPLLYDHNEQCWAQNRRVEFKVYQR